ncbi:hypothetical protein DFJ74DRAFT_769987 [Hyaloraphidium curvatum]|nr:hypothetical protein DFJ74DRAFT_769987 [Hyaloraphidium curvatum]
MAQLAAMMMAPCLGTKADHGYDGLLEVASLQRDMPKAARDQTRRFCEATAPFVHAYGVEAFFDANATISTLWSRIGQERGDDRIGKSALARLGHGSTSRQDILNTLTYFKGILNHREVGMVATKGIVCAVLAYAQLARTFLLPEEALAQVPKDSESLGFAAAFRLKSGADKLVKDLALADEVIARAKHLAERPYMLLQKDESLGSRALARIRDGDKSKPLPCIAFFSEVLGPFLLEQKPTTSSHINGLPPLPTMAAPAYPMPQMVAPMALPLPSKAATNAGSLSEVTLLKFMERWTEVVSARFAPGLDVMEKGMMAMRWLRARAALPGVSSEPRAPCEGSDADSSTPGVQDAVEWFRLSGDKTMIEIMSKMAPSVFLEGDPRPRDVANFVKFKVFRAARGGLITEVVREAILDCYARAIETAEGNQIRPPTEAEIGAFGALMSLNPDSAPLLFEAAAFVREALASSPEERKAVHILTVMNLEDENVIGGTNGQSWTYWKQALSWVFPAIGVKAGETADAFGSLDTLRASSYEQLTVKSSRGSMRSMGSMAWVVENEDHRLHASC